METSYPLLYQNVTEGNSMFFDNRLLKLSDLYYLEPGFHSSITDFVDAINTLFKKDTITSKAASQLK